MGFCGGEGKRAASFTRVHELVANNECLRDEDLLVGRENHCTNINFSTNQTSQSFSYTKIHKILSMLTCCDVYVNLTVLPSGYLASSTSKCKSLLIHLASLLLVVPEL